MFGHIGLRLAVSSPTPTWLPSFSGQAINDATRPPNNHVASYLEASSSKRNHRFVYVENDHTDPAAFLGFCAHVFLGRESGRSRVKGLGRGWGFAASRARGLGASQTPVEQGWGLRSLPWKGAEASQTPPWSAPYIRPPTLYPLSSTLCVYLVASTR